MVLGKYFTAKNIEDSARTFSLMLSIFMKETKETTENVDLWFNFGLLTFFKDNVFL